MEEMITRNDFDAVSSMEEASSRMGIIGLGDKGFTELLSGSIDVDGTQFEIAKGQKEKQTEKLSWTWHKMPRGGDTLLLAQVQNVSDQPITIAHMKFTAEELPFTEESDARIFIWQTWGMGVERLREGSFVSENLLHISTSDQKHVFLAGFVTLSRMKLSHKVQLENGVLHYEASMGFGKFTLNPGDTFNSELLLLAEYQDPYAALEDWAQKVHDLYQPELPLKAPVGWIGNNWINQRGEEYQAEPTEVFKLENAKAINERLKGFGVEYIWTSQANLKDYIPGNWLKNNEYEIPSGLEGFCKKQQELGFKPGLWASPFWFFGEAEGMYEEHKDHLLRDRDGNVITHVNPWCWSYEDDDSPWYHMHKYYLDGSHPDAIRYVKDIYEYYRSIGVRYYMLDFLAIFDHARLFDETKTPYQAGYNILREIRKSAGEDTHLQTAVASSPGFTGTINAARIGRDFGEGRIPEGGSLNDWKTASMVLHDMHYSNTLYLIRNVAGSYFAHQKTYLADYNAVTIDKPCPVEYARIVSTVFGMGGSNPVMLGDDIRYISDERLRFIKVILPRTPYSAVPADLFDRVQPEDYCRVMKLRIQTDWDDYMLIAAYNVDQHPYDLTLEFEKLGLDGNQVVYDFWNEEYRGVFHTSFPVHIPAESCKLFRITKYREHPWLIGTDMHIQQGAVDIESLSWDEETMTLKGCATRPAGESGNVMVLMPRNYKLKNPPAKVHTLKELLDYRVVVMVPLTFGEDGRCEFSLEFEYWNFHNLSPRGLIPYSNMEELEEYMKTHYTREDNRVF